MKLAIVPVAVLVGVMSLTGCGGSAAPTAAPTAAPSSAASSAASSTTPTPTPTPAQEGPLSTRVSAALASAKSGRAKMTVATTDKNGKPQTMTSTSEFVVVRDKTNVKTAIAAGSDTLELLIVDGASYLKDPAPKAGAKPWLKLDPNGKDLMSLLLGSIFTLVGDPTFLFSKGWDKAAATKVGVEGGLTHYRVSGLEKGQAADLWVDGQDRPMKLTATSPGASAGASGGTVEIVYSDWGAPITVTAPPADQVGAPPSM